MRRAREKKERDKRRAEEGKAIDEHKAERARKSKSATLKKLYKSLQKASARLYQLQNQRQSVLVELEVCGVALLFMSRLQHLHQQSTATAAKYFSHANFVSKFCCIG